MKIMVAGGAGYIGSVLVPILQKNGHAVDVYDDLWFGNHLPPQTPVKQVDLFKVTDADLSGYDQVIFLAGLSNDPMAEHDPAMNFIQNGALPSYLAFRAKQAGVRRFIYASSCSVYGYTVNELYDEDAPVSCSYPYGISKLEGERGVLSHSSDSFSTIALRQGTVNGYSPRMRFDLIINTMYKCAMLDGVITVNNPQIWRPLIDVRDTSDAFLRAVQADYSVSGVFNVAYDNFTVGEVADAVKAEVENLTGKEVRVERHNRQDFRNYKVSTDRARTRLGFTPKHNITDTIKDIHAHHAAYGTLDEDRFYNIRVFKKMKPEG